MEDKTYQACIELTSSFYNEVSESFSDSRNSAWRGWKKAISCVNLPSYFDLLDLACGNLRFEKFLIDNNLVPKRAVCIDNCETLLPSVLPTFVEFENFDLLRNRYKSSTSNFSLSVSFGFFHHIPTFESRRDFLNVLLGSTKKSGYVVVSFWQFLKDDRISKKANEITELAGSKFKLNLEKNDFILGWQERNDVFRYCHHFDEDEIDELVSSFDKRAKVVSMFNEDGKEHNLNKYVILKKL